MLQTPVALIAFKRPELTRRTLAAIREARPETLFLVCDGPRPGREDDATGCAETRAVLEEIDWPCTVHRKYSEANLGCEGNVELGLDWVFSQVDRAIILEDDCIPDPTFFRFADELLERYADDERVWHVAGNSHWVDPALFAGDSYRFSTWASVWGWATWARAWQAHRAVFTRTHAGTENTGTTVAVERTRPLPPSPGSLSTVTGERHFAHVAESVDGDAYGWDSHWWVTIMAHGGLSATPALNLVANDGFGEGATHTRSSRPVTPSVPQPFPLVHPAQVALDVAVERELELVLMRANGRLARAARKVIKPLWMRAIVRRVVTSPAATRVLRGLSRSRSRVRELSSRPGSPT
jgi:hypothetical protein